MTNLLQIPKFFDLDIYTTGRLEKVCELFVLKLVLQLKCIVSAAGETMLCSFN